MDAGRRQCLAYTGWAKKSDTSLVFEFRLLLDALYLQFLFTRVSFSLNVLRSSSADVNKFCSYANVCCDFVTMVGLTNDERC